MGDDRGADTTTVVIDPDRLATLEEERSFLLRSLRDLDAEHAAGDVDEHDYVTLRDGYTKRAADVMREIDDGRARLPPRRRASWSRRLGVGAAVVAVAAGAGWLVARRRATAWRGRRSPVTFRVTASPRCSPKPA